MRFKQIQPTINDISAEMLEWDYVHGRLVPTGILKDISYEDAHINAQMCILENELADFFDDAYNQCSGGPGDEFY